MGTAAEAQDFARSCDPIPYRMSVEISRDGIDCSGFMSAILNHLQDRSIWVRRFSTGTIRDVHDTIGFKAGKGDPARDFEIGVMYPWESSSGIGHTAGTLAGLDVESRGGVGVLIGADARSSRNGLFGHHYHLPLTDGEADVPLTATEVDQIVDRWQEKYGKRLGMWIGGKVNAVYNPDALSGTPVPASGPQIAAIRAAVGELSDDEAKILAAIAGVDAGMSDAQVQAAASQMAETLKNSALPEAFVAALKNAL
jgi:hypothetical protein